MASKTIETVEIHDTHNDVKATIPIGIVEGAKPGKTLGVVGGVHGTEYAAHDAVLQFWDSLDPANVSGSVLVVLTADTTALTHKSAYLNPVDGKNLNRVWPGDPSGTITEIIAHEITSRVVQKSDAVIDVHGGEWDEAISMFIITHSVGDEDLDRRTVDLAIASGFPFIEVTDARGPILGKGTGSSAAMLSGVPAMTFEAGGEGLRERRYIEAHVQGLQNIARYMGIIPGDLTTWAGIPAVLDHGILMKTTVGGLVRPAVEVGDWIAEGQLFSEILGYDGTVLEQLLAPEAGSVIDVITARGIKAGAFAGKIAVCTRRDVGQSHGG